MRQRVTGHQFQSAGDLAAKGVVAQVGALLLLGGVSGVAAKMADESSFRFLSDVTTFPTLWLMAAVLMGRFSQTWWIAYLGSSAFFLAMCTAYYAWSAVVLGYPTGRYLAIWSIVAISIAPATSMAVQVFSRRSGTLAAAVMAVVGSMAMMDGSLHQLWLNYQGLLPPGLPLRSNQAVFDLVVSCSVVGLTKDRRTRLIAFVILVPACMLVMSTFDNVADLAP